MWSIKNKMEQVGGSMRSVPSLHALCFQRHRLCFLWCACGEDTITKKIIHQPRRFIHCRWPRWHRTKPPLPVAGHDGQANGLHLRQDGWAHEAANALMHIMKHCPAQVVDSRGVLCKEVLMDCLNCYVPTLSEASVNCDCDGIIAVSWP